MPIVAGDYTAGTADGEQAGLPLPIEMIQFAHKSLAEFFVAFKFATELDCLKSKFSKTYTEADGNACRIPFESKNISELAKTFGLLKLTDERMIAVRKLLQKIVDDYNSEKLWENIFQTCGIDSGHVRFVGGNLATLLRDQGELFTYTDMSKTNLSGADLCGVNLSYTDLTSSHLHEININHLTNFNETDLTNASISVGNFDDSAYTINTINQDGTLIGVGMEDKIKVYNLISKELIFESKQICHSGIFPAFSPNGDKLAGGSKEWIKVWDLSTGREELTIKLNPIDNVIIIPVFSPKGDHIAARAKEWLKIWNSSNGEEIIAIDLPVDLNWELISNFMIYPSFSPDGKNIVIGDGDGVSIWDSIKGTKLQTIQIKRDADEVVCPVFSPNGEHIAIHSKNSLTILETSTNKELLVIDFPKGQAFSICPAFHPNNNKIIGASHKYLRTWDIKDGGVDLDIPCDSLYLMNMISVDRYGRLVTGIFDNHSSRVWSLDTGEEVYVSEEQLNCKNMNITGTHGLEQQITWMTRNGGRSSSLLEFFADRGAILDEEQQRIRAELHHKREERQRIRAELLRKRAAEQRLKRAEDEQRQAAEETAAAEPAKKPRARRKKGAE